MDLLDLLLVLVIVVYAVSGYRRGLVAGCVSLAGFVGGAAVGVAAAVGDRARRSGVRRRRRCSRW
ncbi:hypothetical protein LT493_41570 [Streptomyces tricolor]|nr:hypothetical protein [Streptomyces tricolor]